MIPKRKINFDDNKSFNDVQTVNVLDEQRTHLYERTKINK